MSGSESIREVSLEVVATRERNGFRTFVIEIQRDEHRKEIEVVAIGGNTLYYDAAHDTVGAPIIAFAGGAERPDPIPCSFSLLDATTATCQRGGRDADVPASSPSPSPSRSARRRNEIGLARPPVAFEGAAPFTFEERSSRSGLATFLVAVVTLGLVILPDGSSGSTYTLVSTHRGQAGAPEAPPG